MKPHSNGTGSELRTFIGVDIGGTKSAVVLMTEDGGLVEREQFATEKGKDRWRNTTDSMIRLIRRMTADRRPAAVGISCGGPLDSVRGRILSPPNLQGWDDVPIVEILEGEFGVPAFLENDANAGALAEWQFGAGRGSRNMVFLTFGTGLGTA
jgi:glucokinase